MGPILWHYISPDPTEKHLSTYQKKEKIYSIKFRTFDKCIYTKAKKIQKMSSLIFILS